MTATNIFFNFVGFRYSPALNEGTIGHVGGTRSRGGTIGLRGDYRSQDL